MKLQFFRNAVTVVIFCLFVMPSTVQSQALTVLAVKSALESALEGFRDAASQLTHDMQSLGNSLQANAQNVIRDLDDLLEDNIELTFEELDDFELRLVEDAQNLTALVERSTLLVLEEAGNQARQTIVEADILAYNTSYSLPCRSSVPRVLSSSPETIELPSEATTVRLQGNFLRQGGDIRVSFDGEEARVVERLDTAISAEIPESLRSSTLETTRIVSVSVDGLTAINRSLRLGGALWGIFGCSERETEVEVEPLAALTGMPTITYNVSGSLITTHLVETVSGEAPQRFENTGNNRCDDYYRVDRQWCLAGEGSIADVQVTDRDFNCRSSFEGVTPSGDRCVLVRATVGGCGADRGPFNTWLGCRGRGWGKYTIQLFRRSDTREVAGTNPISVDGVPGQRTFSFDFPAGGRGTEWQYQLQIDQMRGTTLIERLELSHANPNAGVVSTRSADGTLSVEIAN